MPKCPVAGPVNTKVMLENSTSDPPVIQTCSVVGPLASKGAGFPLPVMNVAVPFTLKRVVVAGLSAGQPLAPWVIVASVR